MSETSQSYANGLNRYAAAEDRTNALSAEFIGDLLKVTGGRTRNFETARVHGVFLPADASAARSCSAW